MSNAQQQASSLQTQAVRTLNVFSHRVSYSCGIGEELGEDNVVREDRFRTRRNQT